MKPESAEEFIHAIDAMEVFLPALVEWADTRLDGNERKEILHHIGKLTDDFRTIMHAVSDYVGVEDE